MRPAPAHVKIVPVPARRRGAHTRLTLIDGFQPPTFHARKHSFQHHSFRFATQRLNLSGFLLPSPHGNTQHFYYFRCACRNVVSLHEPPIILKQGTVFEAPKHAPKTKIQNTSSSKKCQKAVLVHPWWRSTLSDTIRARMETSCGLSCYIWEQVSLPSLLEIQPDERIVCHPQPNGG